MLEYPKITENTSMDPLFITLSILILLFSVILHEVMHGYAALRFGDRTAEKAGRLTLNPIPHIDPIGTILLPAMLFIVPMLTGVAPGFIIGWAKPVPVNPLNFSNTRQGELMVSLAGVGANFFLALLATFLYHTASIFPNIMNFQNILQFSVSINLILAIFNLLPIPPLDGSKVLLSQLPYKMAREYEKLAPYGIFIILGLLYFGILGLLLRFILIPLHLFLGIPPY